MVGNGCRFGFWEDRWSGEDLLAIRYPRLYSNSVCKQGKTSEMGCGTMVGEFGR